MIAIIGALGGVIYTAIQIQHSFKPKIVFHNTEIVLDRSAGMSEPFGAGTKLDTAARSVEKYISPRDADNLAFRIFGEECNANSELVVKFGQNNTKRIRNALRNIRTKGKANLATAIIEATGDFNELIRFPPTVNKKIIVITGTSDSCEREPARIIRERLAELAAGHSIQVDFRFIGLAIPPDQREAFRKIAQATGAQATFVATEEELLTVLKKFLEVEPVVTDVNTFLAILNKVIGHLNEMVRSIDRRDYESARGMLRAAREEFAGTDLSFRDLATRRTIPDYQMLYEVARQNRETQSQALKLSESMIALARREDIDAYNNAIAEWNGLIETYNQNVSNINQILTRIGR